MSVSRSNSLRRDSPPFPPRRDQLCQENGLAGGPAAARPPHGAGGGREKSRPGARGELEQGKERPRDREERRAQHQQHQPRGQEPGPKGAAAAGSRPPPPEYPRGAAAERDGWREHPAARDCGQPAERVVRRERPEPPERRPKSSYGGESSPQPPRDKRPLSGPDIRTPAAPVPGVGAKTAAPTGRPFNTYPRAETDPGRGAGAQVTVPPALSPLRRPGAASSGGVLLLSLLRLSTSHLRPLPLGTGGRRRSPAMRPHRPLLPPASPLPPLPLPHSSSLSTSLSPRRPARGHSRSVLAASRLRPCAPPATPGLRRLMLLSRLPAGRAPAGTTAGGGHQRAGRWRRRLPGSPSWPAAPQNGRATAAWPHPARLRPPPGPAAAPRPHGRPGGAAAAPLAPA